VCGGGGRREIYSKGFGWVGLKERDKLEDRDISGGYIETGRRGLSLTQDRVVGGLLETEWTFGVRKRSNEEQSASQKWLCFMEVLISQ